jgi:hypothetical protein
MKKSFVLISIVVSSFFFFACEEDAIPVPLPQAPPPAAAEQAAEESAPAPLLLPPEVAPSPPPPPKPAAAPVSTPPPPPPPAKVTASANRFSGDAGQASSGKYVIQIGIFPSESSAKALVRKMENNGISAYYAKVSAPDPKRGLCSVYFRVRVGFFDEKSDAESFARNRLQPLGYSWWVDRRSHDRVGDTDPYAECGFAASAPPPPPAAKPKPVASREDAELEAAKREYQEMAKKATQAPAPAPAKKLSKEEAELEAAKREYQEMAKKATQAKGVTPPPPPPPPRK